MSRTRIVQPDWSARVGDGEARMEALLERSPEENGSGEWCRLSKPGLGKRERWAWKPGGGDLVFVKRYLADGFKAQCDRIFRQCASHSRAYWEYTQSMQLAEAGVPVVRALGFAEEMSGPIERRSAVLFERAPGDAFDRVWLRLVREDSPLTRGVARHEFARRIGRLAAAFHGTGLCHRDLYLCHIFVELDESIQRPPHFTIIDLARLHRPRWRRMRWIVKDLSQLDTSARQIGASRCDRLRALYAYLGLNRFSPRVRCYTRAVTRKSDAILRRIARRSADATS
ncbi:MAG: lipopolysaccharide kinase InaA family protein [Phycisphaerae bacterium]